VRNGFWVLVAAMVLAVVLEVSCVSLEGVTKLTYHVEVQQEQNTQQGTLTVSFTPSGEDWKISVHYKFDGEEFSMTSTTQGKTREEALFSTLLMHPSLGVLLGQIMAAQGVYLPLAGVIQGKPEVGLLWHTRDAEGRENGNLDSLIGTALWPGGYLDCDESRRRSNCAISCGKAKPDSPGDRPRRRPAKVFL